MNDSQPPPQSPQRPTPNFAILAAADGESKKDDALAALESAVQAEKDARMEERFVWIVIAVILVDVIWFRNSPNPTFPIAALILELIALLVIARRMGVKDYVQLMDRILQGFGQRGGG